MKKVDNNRNIKGKLKQIEKILNEEIKAWKACEAGWDNLVLEINNEWIFRFARRKEDIKRHQKEKEITEKFGPISPCPIPKSEFFGKDFIGYRKIKGQPLTRQTLLRIKPGNRKAIVNQLASFLSTLHSFSEPLKNIDVKWPSGKDWLYKEVFEKIVPELSDKTRRRIRGYLNKAFADKEIMGGEKTLVHGDFHGDNIIVKNNKMAGIIDFGDAQIGTPAMDFAKLYCYFDLGFTEEVLKNYNRPLDKAFGKRLDFMILFMQLMDARFSIYLGRVETHNCALLWPEENFGDKEKRL